MWGITTVALIALTGFLCWHFNSGWFVFTLLFIGGLKTKIKEDAND